jgi:hypothetical protein
MAGSAAVAYISACMVEEIQ